MRTIISLTALMMLTACSGTPPTNLGVKNGELAPCPDSPNCVSSFSNTAEHKVLPLTANLEQVRSVVADLSEAKVVQSDTDYLRLEFTSSVFRFVDDVEFLHLESDGVTHVRSASRLGHSDLGVNRERVERIRQLLER